MFEYESCIQGIYVFELEADVTEQGASPRNVELGGQDGYSGKRLGRRCPGLGPRNPGPFFWFVPLPIHQVVDATNQALGIKEGLKGISRCTADVK